MSGRSKTIIAGVFLSILVIAGAVVAILIAFKQTAEKPAAPTVPQVTPHAAAPGTPACTLTFTVAAAQSAICDSLTANPDSGTAPLSVSFTLSGHASPTGSIINYKFDFGDGSTPVGQTGSTISHTFSSEGTFTVSGTVVDNLGNVSPGTAACQKTINTSRVVYKFKKCETGVNNAQVCKEEDCVPNTTPCSGLSTCKVDADCQPKFQHKVCLGSACSVVDCSPPTVACADSCTSDASCVSVPPPPPATPTATATHRECRNRACIVVVGAGTDTCNSDVSCQPKAVPPPIPKSGNTAVTVGAIVLGVGAVVAGLLLLL